MQNPINVIKDKTESYYWRRSMDALEKHYDAHKNGNHELATALYRRYLKYRRKAERMQRRK